MPAASCSQEACRPAGARLPAGGRPRSRASCPPHSSAPGCSWAPHSSGPAKGMQAGGWVIRLHRLLSTRAPTKLTRAPMLPTFPSPLPTAQRTRWLSALMKRLCSSCVHTRRDLRPPPPAAPASLAGGSSSMPASPLGSGLALLLGAPPVTPDAKPAGAAPGAGAGAAAGAGGAIEWNSGSAPSGGGPFRGWPSTAVAALTGGGSMGMPSTGGGAMGGGGASG